MKKLKRVTHLWPSGGSECCCSLEKFLRCCYPHKLWDPSMTMCGRHRFLPLQDLLDQRRYFLDRFSRLRVILDRNWTYRKSPNFDHLFNFASVLLEIILCLYTFFMFSKHGKTFIFPINIKNDDCFALSPWRPYEEYKRMVLEHTHGLFIT